MDMRCRITSGGREPRESVTENKPPPQPPSRAKGGREAARVKWCGKSAPRLRQRRRQGKPHREQDRIGTARGFDPCERLELRDPCPDPGRPGRLLKASGN